MASYNRQTTPVKTMFLQEPSDNSRIHPACINLRISAYYAKTNTHRLITADALATQFINGFAAMRLNNSILAYIGIIAGNYLVYRVHTQLT